MTGESPAEFFGRENNYSGSHDATAKQVESAPKPAGMAYDAMRPKQRREYDLQERLKGNA